MRDELAARAVAFYLPQFHPIPENDEWWGAGFTEWTNTAKARALFPGHDQPHLPADLGFYDLRLPEARAAQSELAQSLRRRGVLLLALLVRRRPADPRTALRGGRRLGDPSISFCLGWANQSWTGIWHGAADRMLLEQTYLGAEDDQAHFDTVLSAFRDERYLRVDGKPVFYVFRPEELPDAAAFVDRWQSMASGRRSGRACTSWPRSATCSVSGSRYTRVAADGFDAGCLRPAAGTDRTARPVADARSSASWADRRSTRTPSILSCETPCAAIPPSSRASTRTGTTRHARSDVVWC